MPQSANPTQEQHTEVKTIVKACSCVHPTSESPLRQVLLDDMSEAYNALRAGRPPCAPLVRLQYPDFAAWQIRHLASPAVQRQVQAAQPLALLVLLLLRCAQSCRQGIMPHVDT